MLLLLSSLFTRPDDRHNREYFNIAICLLGTSHQVSLCHFDGKLELPTRSVKPEAADRLSYLPQYLPPLILFLILRSLSILRTSFCMVCVKPQESPTVWRNPFAKGFFSIIRFMTLPLGEMVTEVHDGAWEAEDRHVVGQSSSERLEAVKWGSAHACCWNTNTACQHVLWNPPPFQHKSLELC